MFLGTCCLGNGNGAPLGFARPQPCVHIIFIMTFVGFVLKGRNFESM